MVDIDAAIGFVVAHGDPVDRARLSWLVSGTPPHPDVLAKAEMGQAPSGGWPALWGAQVASVDATCFRLGELDDLGALQRGPARRALSWFVASQHPDGCWEEDDSLLATAPPWAAPGNAEARLYLTANAGYWLAVAGPPPSSPDTRDTAPDTPTGPLTQPIPAAQRTAAPQATPVEASQGAERQPGHEAEAGASPPPDEAAAHRDAVARATGAFRAQLRQDGSWPSFLVAGWLGAALLYHAGEFYESAQIQVILADRMPEMSPGDVANLAASLRRVGIAPQDWVLTAARRRLSETQRSDGGWPSDDGPAFDVHVTLAAIRAVR